MKALASLLLASLACLSTAGRTLTSVAEAKRVNLEDLTTPRDFEFTGTLLKISQSVLTFADDTGGAYMSPRMQNVPDLRQWDVLRVKGEMVVDDPYKTRLFIAREVEVVRHGSPRPPVQATAQEITDGKLDFTFVRIRGVFASCVRDEVAPDVLWANLKTDSGDCLLSLPASAFGTRFIPDMTDAEVEITGLAAPIAGLRQNLGRILSVSGPDAITLLKPPPKDPIAARRLAEASASSHRQCISGDVMAASRNHFFLRTGIGRIIKVILAAGQQMPHVGSQVDVAGFQEYVPYWLSLSDAVVRTTGRSERPLGKPRPMAIEDLFKDAAGRKRFRTNLTGLRLTIQGKVVSAQASEMELSDGENSVFVVTDAVGDLVRSVPETGSIVEATGLFWSEFHNKYESDIYPTFLRFMLYPRDADDIRTIASPPWWTPYRLMVLVLVLVALLAVSAGWSFAVNRKAERRGRELYEERASHAIAEKKVEERTRLAVELHDSLSQTLTGIAMQLEVGNNATAQTMLASCRNDLRRCLWDLRSRTFEEKDMTEAIERTLEPHSVGAKISVRFNVPRESLSDSMTHAILHIVRELVVNAIRHGKAKEIKVAGECHAGTISFSVRDDGCGFDPSAAPGPNKGHFGLLGIRERLKALHGTVAVESSPDRGTRVSVVIKNPPR